MLLLFIISWNFMRAKKTLIKQGGFYSTTWKISLEGADVGTVFERRNNNVGAMFEPEEALHMTHCTRTMSWWNTLDQLWTQFVLKSWRHWLHFGIHSVCQAFPKSLPEDNKLRQMCFWFTLPLFETKCGVQGQRLCPSINIPIHARSCLCLQGLPPQHQAHNHYCR